MAKSDPNKFEGPIASRYGERLRQAAMEATTPMPPSKSPHPELAREDSGTRLKRSNEGDDDQANMPAATPQSILATGDSTCIRVIVSTVERDELDTLLNNISKAVGARVKLANVLRASISQLLNAEEQIVSRAQKARHDFGARPANSDALALARFEDQLRNVVEAGLVDAARKARP